MLHVLVGPACNNNCVFCMESDRTARKHYVENQTDNDIAKAITEYSQRDEIMFTSGEPTMNRKLQNYISLAKNEGFRVVSIISNGRRFSYPSYAQELLQLGINKITVSIHGHLAPLHDSLTCAKGAFDQTTAGLLNLKKLKHNFSFELHTSTVLVKKNTPHLPAIHSFLQSFTPDRICFNVMMAKGRGYERFEQLMPRYSSVVDAMHKLASTLSPAQLRKLSLLDIPRCVALPLPPIILGACEHFHQFEPIGSLGITGMAQEQLTHRALQGDGAARQLLQLAQDPKLLGDRNFYLTSRTSKDELLRSKRKLCETCSFDPQCPGVWNAYASQRGWNEFTPIG